MADACRGASSAARGLHPHPHVVRCSFLSFRFPSFLACSCLLSASPLILAVVFDDDSIHSKSRHRRHATMKGLATENDWRSRVHACLRLRLPHPEKQFPSSEHTWITASCAWFPFFSCGRQQVSSLLSHSASCVKAAFALVRRSLDLSLAESARARSTRSRTQTVSESPRDPLIRRRGRG